jgi:predicted esterase
MLLTTALASGSEPVITHQPQPCTNVAGTTAEFWVTAIGTEPLAYQWQKLGASWANLSGCTATNLILTNVLAIPPVADYRVVITNVEGSVTSDVARLTVLVPPRITPTTSLQHTAVFLGSNVTFSVTAIGTGPLSYQWRRDNLALVDKTNSSLSITSAEPTDEGDYIVVVTNLAGAATSEPFRLHVVPPTADFIRGNFTNTVGQRLPYFSLIPTNYNPNQRYPLICLFHGTSQDENNFLSTAALTPYKLVFSTYRQQATDPAIVVWPTRRAGETSWTSVTNLIPDWLDWLMSQFSIDTNRVYIGGGSSGVPAAWVVMGMRPGYFAAAVQGAGGSHISYPASTIKDVPSWWSCGGEDTVNLPTTRAAVIALRQAGGNPIYTEYKSGSHAEGISMLWYTPAFREWFFAQRRNPTVTNEPLLSIASPTEQPVHLTGAAKLDVAGSAGALGETIIGVSWTNLANNTKGIATGNNAWSVTGIPLLANKTNFIIVAASTTSWAPAFGGSTTFNDTLTIIQSPIRATLALHGTNVVLNWIGGGPPYRVQRATELTAGAWSDILANATPPLLLSAEDEAAFYRVIGQ